MSSLTYEHALTGKSVGAGLPLRPGSKLYHVEPELVYPNAFSTGLDSDQHAYHRGVFLRVPHLPITRVIEPYIDNHKNGGANFTRHQYHVIKRGQPVMASTKRQQQIGFFSSDAGDISTRQYVDPTELKRSGTLVGYANGTDVGYALKEGETGDAFVTESEYQGLDAADQSKYESTKVLPAAEFNALPKEAEYDVDGNLVADGQDRYRAVYEGTTDTNDRIATGGQDQRQVTEEALLGSTDLVQWVTVDADDFYFGQATDADGFIYPSTGGFDRVAYFDETDRDARVVLPDSGNDESPFVQPLGNVTDVTLANAANFRKSAVILEARPTIGFAHTDLEQTSSYQFHNFQTGLDLHSPMRKGRHLIPFVNVVKLKAVVAKHNPAIPFDFTDLTNKKSGLKVGVAAGLVNDTERQNIINQYSLPNAADSGYWNLHKNFGAPFVSCTRDLELGERLVPDLFANFVPLGSGYFRMDATQADAEAEFGAANVGSLSVDENKDGRMTSNVRHVCGEVLNIFDMPAQSMIKYVVNPQYQLRHTSDALTEGYNRVRSADNAGLEPILSDFILMVLGGSSYEWADSFLPEWDGRRQHLSKIVEDFIVEGAVGMVEIAADTQLRGDLGSLTDSFMSPGLP
jgi:hypothetical protein